jgi:hypothetical protein
MGETARPRREHPLVGFGSTAASSFGDLAAEIQSFRVGLSGRRHPGKPGACHHLSFAAAACVTAPDCLRSFGLGGRMSVVAYSCLPEVAEASDRSTQKT